MTMTTGPNLQIIKITVALTGKLTLQFSSPYQGPLFVGLVTLTPNATVTSFKGKVTLGADQNNGGLCPLQVNPTLLTSISTFLLTNGVASGLETAIVYDDVTFLVSDMVFGSGASSQSIRTSTAEINEHVGIGNVNAELKALHQTIREALDTWGSAPRGGPPGAPPDSGRRTVDESSTGNAVPAAPGQKKRK